jgi:hypothetical protein
MARVKISHKSIFAAYLSVPLFSSSLVWRIDFYISSLTQSTIFQPGPIANIPRSVCLPVAVQSIDLATSRLA